LAGNDMERELDEIIGRIEILPPHRRRLLFRHLKAMGLLESEDLLSDRNPLEVVPAVKNVSAKSKAAGAVLAGGQAAPPRPGERPRPGTGLSRPTGSGAVADPALAKDAPVRDAPAGDAPAERLSVSGQVPAEPVRIVFDGGSRGNPGQGYGSYALDWPGQPRQVVRLSFGDDMTNNEAEYDTLIAALEAVHQGMVDKLVEPESTSVSIWGDSQLVCKQVRGEWRCKEPRLRTRLEKARAILGKFGVATLDYHPREKSVEILGH